MKRTSLLIIVLSLFLCGCAKFTMEDNIDIVSDSGVVYTHIANEPALCYLGALEFAGSVQGEAKTSQHLGMSYKTGMFVIKQDENQNVLIRYAPNSEWYMVYRNAALPAFVFSLDNCIRLEFVPGYGSSEEDFVHTTCGEGLTDPDEISAFLSDIRAQENPQDAGLYDLARNPDGTMENCYVCGVIYGFFAEEPNVVIRMEVTSYNDQAYSISMKDSQYVLPTAWLQKLQGK